jgi:hypothetical protein
MSTTSTATRRLNASEIEQALWNATELLKHRSHPERKLVRSMTDGGKPVVVIVELVRDGIVRPITGREENNR